MDALVVFVVSVVMPWILERLKTERWFPFMKPYGTWVNRATPIVVAALVAAGVTVSFDDVSGTLTVRGLIPSDILRGLLLWAGAAVTQHVTFEKTVKPNTLAPLLVLGALCLMPLAACASNPRERVVMAYRTADIGLSAVQDAERAAFAAGLIPKDVHQQRISPAFVNAFDAQIRFGHALLVWRPGTRLPIGYDAWLETITNTVAALNEVMPRNRAVLDAVVVWVRQAVEVIKQLRQDVPPSLAMIAEQ